MAFLGSNAKEQKLIKYGLLILLSLGLVAFWDKALAGGIIFLVFLSLLAFLIISKSKLHFRELFFLFLIALFIHTAAVLFLHYTGFQPFGDGGGDFIEYNFNAQEIAQRIRQGDFSLSGLRISHYYSVFVGYVYAFTLPDMLIGQLLNAWLVALTVLLAYLISFEVTASKRGAFLVGLLINVYPSFLFFGSLMLKDALVVFFALTALLFTLGLLKHFSGRVFIVFYLTLLALVHLRLYVGYALILAFLVSWVFFSQLALKKRIAYLFIFIILFGFLPQLGANEGYWAREAIREFVNPKTITRYREEIYTPPPKAPFSEEEQDKIFSTGSTEVIEAGFDNPLTFLANTARSFISTVLGPFPWQMKYKRHFFALFETLPWYLLLFFILRGVWRSRGNFRKIFPLALFSFLLLSVLTLFISNFGITTRIRIPAFIALLCLLPFGLARDNFSYRLYDGLFVWWDKRKQKLLSHKPREQLSRTVLAEESS